MKRKRGREREKERERERYYDVNVKTSMIKESHSGLQKVKPNNLCFT